MSALQFYEEQKIKSPWAWVFALFAPVLMLVVLIMQIASGNLVGNHPASNIALIFMIPGLAIPAIVLIKRLKLTTTIDPEKISYGFNFPTDTLNHIKIADIKECYLTTYGFVGFGYHISRKHGIVYNIGGKKGIQIIKHSGEKILIGTQKWDELKRVFEQPGN